MFDTSYTHYYYLAHRFYLLILRATLNIIYALIYNDYNVIVSTNLAFSTFKNSLSKIISHRISISLMHVHVSIDISSGPSVQLYFLHPSSGFVNLLHLYCVGVLWGVHLRTHIPVSNKGNHGLLDSMVLWTWWVGIEQNHSQLSLPAKFIVQAVWLGS